MEIHIEKCGIYRYNVDDRFLKICARITKYRGVVAVILHCTAGKCFAESIILRNQIYKVRE